MEHAILEVGVVPVGLRYAGLGDGCAHVRRRALPAPVSIRMPARQPIFFPLQAYRRCADCDKVFIFTTPLYALIKCTGSLAGLALSVTPAVAKYRHYTKNRSTGISTFLTGFAIVFLKTLEKKFSKSSDVYYLALFILNAMTPAIMLRLVPALAMWPFSSENKPKAK
ncbi:jg18504 [Pararge aegeria aegeria]|uniref:Jg18504 protein n=1 Tax=Pararge aegeria aegeria TaxID=348720 RepID=A0A8S4S473_9NEOP|nr:jg18504 [Pararge aegeria aegeria]